MKYSQMWKHTKISSEEEGSAIPRLTEAIDLDSLKIFVSLVTVRVLTTCDGMENRSKQEIADHTKRLVDQIMEGLVFDPGFSPPFKKTHKISNEVIRKLKKLFPNNLGSKIAQQQPAVDEEIVQVLRAHISKLARNKIDNILLMNIIIDVTVGISAIAVLISAALGSVLFAGLFFGITCIIVLIYIICTRIFRAEE